MLGTSINHIELPPHCLQTLVRCLLSASSSWFLLYRLTASLKAMASSALIPISTYDDMANKKWCTYDLQNFESLLFGLFHLRS